MAHVRHATGPQAQIDLSMNLPPQPMETDLEGRLTRGIAALQREVGFSAHLNYRDPGGSEAERDIAAGWLRSRIADVRGDRLVICPGTQNALFNLLITLTSPGDIILTEARTGRGTFVAESMAHVRHATDPQAQIDLSMNLPRNRWENNERWRTMGNAI
jgi:DNA-binding transcriptional MocR family regulator